MAHRDAVWALAFAPDGRRALSGAADGTVLVWDFERGAVERTLAGHDGAVRSALVSRDGRRAYTGGRDHAIAIWDLDDGRRLDTLAGHRGGVLGLAELRDGRIASASFDGTLRIWEPAAGRCLATLSGHEAAVQSVACAPSGPIVSASRDRTLRVWDVGSGRELARLRGHRGWVSRVMLAADGRRALSAGEDGSVRVWDLARGVELRALSIGPLPIWGAALSPDGRIGCAAAPDGEIFVWELDSGRELARLECGWRMAPRALAISPDGRTLAAGNDDSSLALFDLERMRLVRRLPGRAVGANTLAVTPNGDGAVLGHVDGRLRIRDGAAAAGHGRFVFALRVTPDGRRAVSVALDGELRVTELATGRTLQRLAHGFPIFSLELFASGRRALIAGGSTVRVFELESGAELAQRAAGPPDAVHAFAALAGGPERFAWVAEPARLVLAALADQTPPQTFALDSDLASGLAVDPTGAHAYVAFAAGSIAEVELATGKALRSFAAHEDWVRDLRLLPDGRRLVSLAQDRTLQLLDLATGSPLPHPFGGVPVTAIALDFRGGLYISDLEGRVLGPQ